MSLVSLSNIDVDFPLAGGGVVPALRGVSLSIEPSQVVAVVGESGSGKSTLGKVALGTLRPTRGEVEIQGHKIWEKGFSWTPELRSVVQVVHQDPFSSLNPVRTVGQTLAAPLALAARRGLVDGADLTAAARHLLESVGLTPADFYLSKYPFQLSGGQKQRVSIARSTIMQPRCIVADEPVSAVDASMRLSILDLMRRLLDERGISFLYVTHDLATARYVVRDGRVIVMYLGVIVEEGPIETVLESPAHPYVEALLAAIPDPDPARAHAGCDLPLKSFDVGSLLDLPPGCPFEPRCPRSVGLCTTAVPSLLPLDDHGHRAACHLVRP